MKRAHAAQAEVVGQLPPPRLDVEEVTREVVEHLPVERGWLLHAQEEARAVLEAHKHEDENEDGRERRDEELVRRERAGSDGLREQQPADAAERRVQPRAMRPAKRSAHSHGSLGTKQLIDRT